MSNLIQARTVMRIHEGKLEEFKKLAEQSIKVVGEKEPDTFIFNWYLNDQETECTVLECFKDSDAMLAHLGNVAHMIQPILEVSDVVQVELHGEPSKELIDAFGAFKIQRFHYFSGAQHL